MTNYVVKEITISKDDVKSQKDMVLWHLKSFKTLTSYQAFKEYGITRLSAIIFNIRKEGYYISSKTETIKNTKAQQCHILFLFSMSYIYIDVLNQTIP